MELMHGCNPAQCAQPQRAQNGINLGSRAAQAADAAERTRVISRKTKESGEPGRNRTFNQQIKSLLLCQLSYGPTHAALLRGKL